MISVNKRRQRVCIIGAGLTGLVAARRLIDSGFDVVILESTPEPGGMVSSFPMGSDRIEHIYHHIFTSDQHLIQLTDELGLRDRLEWHRTRDALYEQGRLFPFSSPLDLLRYSTIPLVQRLKTGLAVLKAGRINDWLPMEKQTAADWLKANSGSQAYEKLWRPLLRSKFDTDADEVSAVWIWNKFKLRGLSRDQKTGREKLGYMHGSFSMIVDGLVQSFRQKGGVLFPGHTAMNISRETGRTGSGLPEYRVSCILENCSTVEIMADAVIATLSGRQFASITTSLELPDEYLKKVRAIHYKGDLCMILRLRSSLSPYYWTTVCDDLPFVAVIEHSRLTGPDRYGGHVVYLTRYLNVTDHLWTCPDSDIFRLFSEGLASMYPHFNPLDVIDWRLRRTRYAQPVIYRHYSGQMPPLDTPEPGVKLAGTAQIYPEDRGMNYAIRLGYQAAESAAAYLSRQDQSPSRQSGISGSDAPVQER